MTQQRTQLAAALLAFFLGMFGAHWYYLGDRHNGNWYLIFFALSLVSSVIIIGCVGLLGLAICCLYDFITLLSMAPADFDARYNSAQATPQPYRR